ncbi:MAG: Gfo/Idh/MocA family oxidoreductase [Lachnospiraceae bacterium]|nr:Gfo/Idh/MocA family oxidoreductase [Lachnospiraceae bacterium]
MNKVRIGIIGLGNMGTDHSKNIISGNVPELELKAVADLKESRRAWAKENLPDTVQIFENGDELIEKGDIDAVLVATPHYDHPRLVIKALNQGLHALSEKPAGVYTLQVREMNEVAAKSDKVFAMMFNQRSNHVYRKMKEIVSSGLYGQIKRVNWIITDWYRTQAYYNSGGWRATWDGEGGGVLLNQCPHNLDLLQWICGLPVKVQAFCHNGKWHDIEVEDDVTAYLEFENGATGVFVTTTGDAPGTNRFEITLERAKLVCENNELAFFEMEVSEREFCVTSTEGFGRPKGEWVKLETDGENLQHTAVLRAFAANILRGEPLIARGEEGINGLMLSNAMHLSSWLGQAVTLPIDEELFLEKLNELRASSKAKVNVQEATFDTTNSRLN